MKCQKALAFQSRQCMWLPQVATAIQAPAGKSTNEKAAMRLRVMGEIRVDMGASPHEISI
ncbi:hypothetical protein GCM10027565_43520 [Bordetella tumulicola]